MKIPSTAETLLGASAASSINRGIDTYQGIFKDNSGMITIDRCGTGVAGTAYDLS
jgi:hypothetical protein